MLYKLHPGQYSVLQHYRDLEIFPLINSVCLAIQPGYVYVDNAETPKIIFVVHQTGFAYLFHSTDTFDYVGFLNFITATTEIPQYFHLYKPEQNLIEFVTTSESFKYRVRDRVQLRYHGKSLLPVPLGAGINLHEIGAGNISMLKDFGGKLINHFWGTGSEFLLHGYGVFLADAGGAPLSICYSAGNTGHLSEIDIATKENYRGRGLAKVVTAAYINLSIKKNILPNWDCFSENTASYKTAVSLGFETIMTYNFLSVFIKDR